MIKDLSCIALLSILAGCATYRPEPLESAPAVLSPPVSAVLERAAGAIERPYLAPVELDLKQPLSANEVAVLAVIGNPDLKAQRIRAGVADAQAFLAGLLPDPTFSAGIDHILSGPDPVDNVAGSLGFNIGALRSWKVVHEKARAEARQVRLDLAWAEWQTAGQARIQAVRVVEFERTAALSKLNRDTAESLLERQLRAVSRGDLDADRIQAARIAASDAAGRYHSAERDLAAARFELARLIGFPPDAPIRVDLGEIPGTPPDAAQLLAIAENQRTDLLALKAGYDAQEADVHKAVLDQFPTLDLTINASRDTGNNRLLGPAVAFSLPLWNRNRGGIAVARATRAALKAEYSARLFQTRAEIAAAVGGIEIARSQRQHLLEHLPELSRFAEANHTAAARGDLSEAAAMAAEQAERDMQLQLAQSEQDIREQTIALELLTGALQETWTQ